MGAKSYRFSKSTKFKKALSGTTVILGIVIFKFLFSLFPFPCLVNFDEYVGVHIIDYDGTACCRDANTTKNLTFFEGQNLRNKSLKPSKQVFSRVKKTLEKRWYRHRQKRISTAFLTLEKSTYIFIEGHNPRYKC